MATIRQSPFPFPPKRVYMGANIPMRVIRRYARAIGERFRPDRVILFGSYAYGTPHEDSDVDLLVVMPTWNEHSQAVQIRMALTAPFPIDLLVRTPKEMKWRLGEGESFLTEVTSRGKILYEKDHGRVGEKGRGRLSRRARGSPKKSSGA
jgi:predicted nucleotidyltransferase